jgi:DNA-binding CsgD family transcriptional regulator
MSKLTPQQLRVVELISHGKTYIEVSEAMDISPDTVRSHMREIRLRLGVHSMAHAVATLLRDGVIQ